MELELDPLFGEETRNIWLDENKDDLGGFYEEENLDDEQINHDYQAQLMKAIENVFAKGVEYYVWRIEDGA